MTQDDHKEIASIAYNHINLPTDIIWNNGQKIIYTYDAGSEIAKTGYVGAFIYEDNTLQFMPTSEGRFVFSPNVVLPLGTEGALGIYEYHLKDHLGNLRVAVKEPDTLTYLATMELSEVSTEADNFSFVNETYHNDGGNMVAKVLVNETLLSEILSHVYLQITSLVLSSQSLYSILTQSKKIILIPLKSH